MESEIDDAQYWLGVAKLAAAGLGVSDSVHRIIALFISVVSMVSGMGTKSPWFHGVAWLWCTGIAMAHGDGGSQCTMRGAYIPLFALQLLFSRLISFRVLASFFRPTTPACIYTCFHFRSISNRHGSLLSTQAMGLDMPPVTLLMAMR